MSTAELTTNQIKKEKLKRAGREAARSRLEVVAETLESYARRGLFRGFSQERAAQNARATFRLLWHRNRIFEFIFDTQTNTTRIPLVLPNVPANSAMYRELKRFIKARQAAELPDHRRIDNRKAQAQACNRGGTVSLTLQIKDGDDAYAARKLIHLVHEIFLTFLLDGRYYDYLVENFDLDPDHI
jgi:hypothetical protein